jgi:hypothetical protein
MKIMTTLSVVASLTALLLTPSALACGKQGCDDCDHAAKAKAAPEPSKTDKAPAQSGEGPDARRVRHGPFGQVQV